MRTGEGIFPGILIYSNSGHYTSIGVLNFQRSTVSKFKYPVSTENYWGTSITIKETVILKVSLTESIRSAVISPALIWDACRGSDPI